jgi:nucleoside-diphosphate-sugar epimerase
MKTKVLLTGASSFTGLWFAEALAAQGFDVLAPLRRSKSEYEGLRGVRVDRLSKVAEIIEDCPFGSADFLNVVRRHKADILCHHAAEVTAYKSPDFDAEGALHSNTYNLSKVLSAGSATGMKAVVLTGTVFQAGEGKGTEPRESVSPYGLSKTLTCETFKYWCRNHDLPLTHFIIPNPFGPYEEKRFCDYLMTCWASGQKAVVKTPDYIRDNIPVSLLSKAYAACIERVAKGESITHLGPSWYQESQGAFTQRMARELAGRLALACDVELSKQTDFSEPLERCNTDTLDIARLGWDEKAAWDGLADYYSATYLKKK